jgi:hypothetical protein
MKRGTLKGNYRTRRDGGLKYTYEVKWTDHGKGAIGWLARVRLGEDLKGIPTGLIERPVLVDIRLAIATAVHSAIEDRVSVE